MRRLARHENFNRFADPADATAAAIADILHNSDRSPAWPGRASGVAGIEQLIRAGARIDAALALIALELPQWQLRRIVYDDGQWHCALSRVRELPDWLDQSAEGGHADLALAILAAAVEAQRIAASACRPDSSLRPVNEADELLCCDNFS